MGHPLGSLAAPFAIPACRPSEALTLLASGARTPTAGAYGSEIDISGYSRLAVLLSVTNADTDAGDTLDVYVDVSPDGGTTYLNAIHFAQVIGTDAASKAFAVLDASAPGTSVIAVTADANAGAVRPTLFGGLVRVRYVIVNAGAADASFTFGVKAFAS
jgi:hypothetical protein